LIPKTFKALPLIITLFIIVQNSVAQSFNDYLSSKDSVLLATKSLKKDSLDTIGVSSFDSKYFLDSIKGGLKEDVRLLVSDSLKSIKLDYYRASFDSTFLINKRDSLTASLSSLLKDSMLSPMEIKVVKNQIDSLKSLIEIDSSTIVEQIKAGALQYAPDKIIKITNNEISTLKNIKTQLDSGNTDLLERKLEQLVSEEIKEGTLLKEMQTFEPKFLEFPYQSPENFNWDKAKMASSAKVGQLVAANSEKITESISKVNKLKKKYSHYELGDSSKELQKRNIPAKRWNINLNIESKFKPYFNIKMAPGLAYNLNSKFLFGAGTSFDYQYHYNDSAYHQFSREFSVRFYSQYKIYKNLFVQAEYEQPYLNQKLQTERKMLQFKKQTTKFWIGGGIEYKLYKKLKAQTQLLYNILPPRQLTEVGNRWTVRINLIY
jgi:hypothetical protein